MRIENFVRFDERDFPDAPDWFKRFAANLNSILEDIVVGLQSNLTSENENAFIFDLSIQHGQEFTLEAPTVTGTIEEVDVIWSEEAVSDLVWSLSGVGIRATVNFVSAPVGQVAVRVKVKGGE